MKLRHALRGTAAGLLLAVCLTTPTLALTGTEKMTPQTGRDIYIEGGRIGAVADAAARREGYEVVDLGGQYVLPGLINLHVHLPASGKPVSYTHLTLPTNSLV